MTPPPRAPGAISATATRDSLLGLTHGHAKARTMGGGGFKSILFSFSLAALNLFALSIC